MRIQCQDMAQKFFDQEYTLLWDKNKDSFRARYNKRMNKCFIEIDASMSSGRIETHLYNVVDNKEFADFLTIRGQDGLYTISSDGNIKPRFCVVSDYKCKYECKNEKEFEGLVKPYMEE